MKITAEVLSIMKSGEDIVLNLIPLGGIDRTFKLPTLNSGVREDRQLYIPVERNSALLEMLPGDTVELMLKPSGRKKK